MLYFWWTTLLIKCLLVSFVPLTADENYYWVWSQNLSLSYFDHPPFVAWLFKIGQFLPEFMLKWPAVFFAHLSFLLWYYFLKNIGFTEFQCKRWFLLSLLAPLVGLASLILTPDLPLLFFYSLAIFSFERALKTEKFRFYALFGFAVGIGFTAKYHIVLILPCLLIYLLTQGLWRKIRWKFIAATLICTVLGAMPVLYWNYHHDWISFRFQLQHGLGSKGWKPQWPLDYLVTILLFIFPSYWSVLFRAIKDHQQKLLLSLALPIFGFFLFSSFRSKVEGNWSQLAFLPTLSILAFYDENIKSWRVKSVVGFWAACLIIIISFWRQPWYKNCPEKLCEPNRYQSLIDVEKKYSPFFASSYQMASFLWFKTKQPVYKLYDMSRTDFYDTLPESKPNVQEFYLAKHNQTELPSWLQEQGYQSETIKNIDEELVLVRVYR